MTYREAIEYLQGIRLFGQQLGLEATRAFLSQLGNPQDGLRFIHIAGTNGKGSVAALTSAALTAAGYRTGMYTSPHLVSFCERFQIDGNMISEADAVRWVEKLRPLLDAKSGPRALTFFEAVTAMALGYFKEQGVEVVVWETGLGGKLDATNVVTPLVSVITNIGFDHMQYLGQTLQEIAGEKAGIIKPGVPVVTVARGEALQVIGEVARQNDAPVMLPVGARVREDEHGQEVAVDGKIFWIPLLGPHQVTNCATAVAALRASGLKLSDEQIREGFRKARWPGRFQVIDGKVVLDGAHNEPAARELAAALAQRFEGKRLALVLGVLRDKQYRQVCEWLAPLAEKIFCVPVNSERRCEPEELAAVCRKVNPGAVVSVCVDVAEGYRRAMATGDVVVITGSLFLVGEAMSRLRLGDGPVASCETELGLQ